MIWKCDVSFNFHLDWFGANIFKRKRLIMLAERTKIPDRSGKNWKLPDPPEEERLSE